MKKDVTQGVHEPGIRVTKRPQKSEKRAVPKKEHVTKSMTVSDIITQYPQATEIMAEYGLHCFSCSVNELESVEEGCLGHGFSQEDIENLVTDINLMIDEMPPRPQTLTVTESAAIQIGTIAKAEGKEKEGLSVLADEHGGFFMEFRLEPERGDKTFHNEKVPHVKIFASPLTLQRIGGATIDFREDRFKLDIEEVTSGCACGGNCSSGGTCNCKK